MLSGLNHFCFHTQEGSTINLLNPNQMQYKHQVRAALRDFVFRTNKAFLSRQDMQGGYRVAYEPTVALIRQDLSKKGKTRIIERLLACLFCSWLLFGIF